MIGLKRPYKRTVRQLADGSYDNDHLWRYIKHQDFSSSPDFYIRAFNIIQKDFVRLTEYIEPADANLVCFSFRLHELITRCCIEVEANCRAILRENGYSKSTKWNITDFRNVERSHYLSEYEVKVPFWKGDHGVRKPFAKWKESHSLDWYQIYNNTKHDRHENFSQATYSNAKDSICGLVALLSSQFYTLAFDPSDNLLSVGGRSDGFEDAIGGFFRVRFPDNLRAEDRYSFSEADWKEMQIEDDPFVKFPY